MQIIPLKAIPNQSFNMQLDGGFFTIVLKETNGVMAATISLDNVVMIESYRCVAGEPLIPSLYQEAGNFIFTTQNFALPYYSEFGVSQSLIYAAASDLAVIRTAAAPIITVDYFNPIASPPKRFAPTGYV